MFFIGILKRQLGENTKLFKSVLNFKSDLTWQARLL